MEYLIKSQREILPQLADTSSTIKASLKFNIAKVVVVVNINENGFIELVRDLRSATEYHIPEEFITYPVNFRDLVFEKIFRQNGPFDIVATRNDPPGVGAHEPPAHVQPLPNDKLEKSK